MSQGTFNDGDQLSVVRTVINSNANDAESRLGDLELPSVEVLTVGGALTSVRSSYDAAALGTATFTLPTPTAGLNGTSRDIWRTGGFSTGGEYLEISGHIDGTPAAVRRVGLANEFVKYVCDGTTWLENGHTTQAFCTVERTTAGTFPLTTSFTTFTTWDALSLFDTPGRLTWDPINSQVQVPVVENSFQDGYAILMDMDLEYTKDRVVTGIIAIDGVPTNGEFHVNPLGSGKPVSLIIPIDIGFPSAASTMELQLKGETAGTLDILSARWTTNRIKG